jgi:hypothetical protein
MSAGEVPVICERALLALLVAWDCAEAEDIAESIEELRGVALLGFVAVDAIGDVEFEVVTDVAAANVLKEDFVSGTESRRCCSLSRLGP